MDHQIIISSLVLSLPSVTNPSSHALRHLLPHLGPGGKMALTDNEVIVLIIFYIVLILVALAIYIFIKYSVTIVHHAEVMVIGTPNTLHTCKQTSTHTCKQTSTHTHVQTNKHTHTYTYTHTFN